LDARASSNGTIGVVLTFLTWLMLIGFATVLGAAGGAA
jgi:uncharacterized BrkB/YihY/UPF0761 family membrane protein